MKPKITVEVAAGESLESAIARLFPGKDCRVMGHHARIASKFFWLPAEGRRLSKVGAVESQSFEWDLKESEVKNFVKEEK